GFSMDEKARRRAGLDYWEHVDCVEHASWEEFLQRERPPRLWLFTTKASRLYWNADFHQGDYLLFGRETRGVDDAVHELVTRRWGDDHRLVMPMVERPAARSLNLATAVCAAVYEGWRQIESGE